MNEEKQIVILEDDNKVIRYQDIVIKTDTIDRDDVAAAKLEIESLTNQKTEIDQKIIDLKAKIMFAEKIIEIANMKKAAENAAEPEVENAEETSTETTIE